MRYNGAMPKRTREQKIRAQERRFSKEIVPIHVRDARNNAKTLATVSADSSTYQSPATTYQISLDNRIAVSSTQDAQFVRKDLTRIIGLTAIIMSIELFLYWLLIVNHTFGFF